MMPPAASIMLRLLVRRVTALIWRDLVQSSAGAVGGLTMTGDRLPFTRPVQKSRSRLPAMARRFV
jgi:hypothetical protein